MKGFGILIKWFELDVGRKLSRQRGLSEGEKFWSRERDFCRERRREVNSESCPSFKYKTQLNGLKILSRICRALNLNKNESFKVMLRIYRRQNSPQWIEQTVENLSSRQRAKKFGSMDQRSYWECVEQEPRNLDGSRICWDAIEKVESIGKFLDGSRIYWGSIEKRERRAQ